MVDQLICRRHSTVFLLFSRFFLVVPLERVSLGEFLCALGLTVVALEASSDILTGELVCPDREREPWGILEDILEPFSISYAWGALNITRARRRVVS